MHQIVRPPKGLVSRLIPSATVAFVTEPGDETHGGLWSPAPDLDALRAGIGETQDRLRVYDLDLRYARVRHHPSRGRRREPIDAR